MTDSDARTALWLAIEDYSGLWELVWDLRARRPTDSEAALRRAARAAVDELLRHGWVRLYHCREPYGDLQPIDDNDISSTLSADFAWHEPVKDGISVRMAATAAGEDVYASFDSCCGSTD